MNDLHDLLQSAARFPDGELDASLLVRRTTRRRRRRAVTVALTSAVAVSVAAGMLATAAADDDPGRRVETSAAPTISATTTTVRSRAHTHLTDSPATVPTTEAVAPTTIRPPSRRVTIAPRAIAPPATTPVVTLPEATLPPTTAPPTTSTTVAIAWPPACATPAVGVQTFTSLADFDAGIVGRWFNCGSPTVFGTDEIGVEILANHRWKKLFGSYESPTVGVGWGNEGPWTSSDETEMNGPGWYQLNMLTDGGEGGWGGFPTFSADSTHMRLGRFDTSGRGADLDYIRG